MTTVTQRFHVIAAMILGVVVFGVMAWCCYASYPWPSVDTPWRMSYSSMRRWRSALDHYKQGHGEYPDQLLDAATPEITQSFDREDGWDRPFDYRRVETGYDLRCLGSDGRPGGTGLRGDFGPDDNLSNLPKPSFLEFVQRDLPFGMAAGCFVAGLFACLMLLNRARVAAPISITPRQFLVSFIVTSLTSLVVGSGLILVHMASKH